MALTSSQGKANREWGKQAEQIAYEWLLTRGYLIRERNWRHGNTIEIDIIAERDDTIIFIEVKARKGNVVSPTDAVDNKKIQKMCRGGDIYLSRFQHLYKYRFDIVTVTGSPDQYTVNHLQDAFMPPLNGGGTRRR